MIRSASKSPSPIFRKVKRSVSKMRSMLAPERRSAMIRAAPDVSAARSRESAVNASPFGTCTARHEKLGLSAVNRPSSREAARTSSFDSPPRRRGEITPSSASARKPGRFAGSSVVFVPSTSTSYPSRAMRSRMVEKMNVLHR